MKYIQTFILFFFKKIFCWCHFCSYFVYIGESLTPCNFCYRQP